MDPDGYARISRRFLEQARWHLAEGDRLQAGEKIWGAAAHALKAVGEQRGWRHDKHPNILDIGEHLGREFGQETSFGRCLDSAESAHQNFYKNDLNEGAIGVALTDVEILTGVLEVIRNSPPRPYTIVDDKDRARLGRLLGLRRGKRPAIGDYSPVGYSLTHGNNAEG